MRRSMARAAKLDLLLDLGYPDLASLLEEKLPTTGKEFINPEMLSRSGSLCGEGAIQIARLWRKFTQNTNPENLQPHASHLYILITVQQAPLAVHLNYKPLRDGLEPEPCPAVIAGTKEDGIGCAQEAMVRGPYSVSQL